jgi:hypothetical protein
MDSKIIIKASKNLGDLLFTEKLEFIPCGICGKIHVEMSEYDIGFFLEGTNKPVCLDCAKKENPVVYYLWEMGVNSEVNELLLKSRNRFNCYYNKMRYV